MTNYKLMPVEATPQMEQAAEKYWNDRKFKALSDDPRTWKGLYAAMLAAAPVVPVGPVGAVHLAYELGGLYDGSYHLSINELEQVIYAAKQDV